MLVAAIATAGLVAAGCSEQSAAVRVGDTTVSQPDFEDELDAFASSSAFVPDPESVKGELSGSYSQDFVAAVLGQRIEFILVEQLFDERGLEVSADDRSSVTDGLQGALDDMPADVRDSLIEDLSRRTRLQAELGQEEYGRALTEAADSTDIEVSSHYGSWDPDQRTLEPPEGPAGGTESRSWRHAHKRGVMATPAPALRPRIVVCGLGPAGPDLVTVATHDAVARIPHRFLRTARHPSASVVGEAPTFDRLYDEAESIEAVYVGIADALVAAAAEHAEVLYAVPGSPAVAERSVELLLADDRVAVDVLPALSFVDLAWVRLGIDPLEHGVRLVDGHRFDVEAAGERGPLLVAQCDDRNVLSDVKLALGEAASDEVAVTVLQRLGLPDEHIVELPWHELDRVVRPDHLTSLYVPRLATPLASDMAALAEVVRRLRAECPWDRQQTHHSLRHHLLEEAYEVLEALDHLDVEAGEGFDALEEELGDLLFQVFLHATLATEEGRFTLADVVRGISDKLIGRHPHVFGDVTVDSADEVAERWERLKKAEKGRSSVMDGIPATLPALAYALKVQRKAASQGVDWRTLLEGDEALGDTGRRLLDLVDDARTAGDDPETELRIAAEHVRDRFRRSERK